MSDARKLTAIRLSADEKKKLEDLAELDRTTNSDVMRKLIDRSWNRRVRIIK